jgi:ubiquinone biosynthesis monooxygenase Coq7
MGYNHLTQSFYVFQKNNLKYNTTMNDTTRNYSPLDRLCLSLDQALRAMAGSATTTGRAYPAEAQAEALLTVEQRKHAAGLMRVNHAGEVAAQALYHGQGLASRNPLIQQHMQQAAREEGDHLAWCQKRLVELGSHTSYLNPVWYIGSFAIGVAAGFVGDKWSLGFVAETETQVMQHIDHHLHLLPSADQKSMKILQQMQVDETQHRDDAIQSGAALLPPVIKRLMSLTARIMVKTAFWV